MSLFKAYLFFHKLFMLCKNSPWLMKILIFFFLTETAAESRQDLIANIFMYLFI